MKPFPQAPICLRLSHEKRQSYPSHIVPNYVSLLHFFHLQQGGGVTRVSIHCQKAQQKQQ